MNAIDWRRLADKLGVVALTEDGHRERGGTKVAHEALIEIIGDAALRDAVDFCVSGRPGSEVARSVLGVLQPAAAMERCREIFRAAPSEGDAADAINLLMVAADRRVLDWIPEFLASDNVGVRVWAIGIVDQLWIMQQEIEREEAMPLIEAGLRDPDEAVRRQARQVLDMAAEEKHEY